MSVCVCMLVSFILNSTNYIPYSAIYDALKKSKTKHYSRSLFFFFPEDKIQISSWLCELMQKDQSTGFVKSVIDTGQ